MADLKTTSERRDRFRSWLHDDTRDRLSIRAWCVAEDACDDVDTLIAENARLRAAEAEVERLRGALRGAIEELDTIPEDPKRFARIAGMTIPLVRGGLSKALLPAEARAALGEP